MLLKQLSIEQMITNHNVRIKYGYPEKKIVLSTGSPGEKIFTNHKLFLPITIATVPVDLKY